MQENKVKRALQRGETVIGTIIQEVRAPAIAQILAVAGFDFFFIDMEHGSYTTETVADIVLVARLAGIVPLVRVTESLYPLMSRPLDCGAMGLMIPRVETRQQVEQIVRDTKFPPVGQRGCALTRGHSDYRQEHLARFTEWINRETLLVLQIEKRQALENIDGLLSVPGVDVALVGTNDLALSLGLRDTNHPDVSAAIEQVIAACQRHGVAAGIHLHDVNALKRWRDKGMRFLACSTDVTMITEAGSRIVSELRD
jgi:2-keto-3-deoxy-L-rhamnonate aldolase RhmA